MRNKLLLLLLCIIPLSTFSQVWIDSGAVWHYSTFGGGSSVSLQKYEYTKDTIMNGQQCQLIKAKSYNLTIDTSNQYHLSGPYDMPNNYTYVSGDTIFYWNHKEEQFHIFLNFSAEIGDTWVIATEQPDTYIEEILVNANDTSRIEVIDKGTMTINSETYRYMDIQPTYGSAFGMEGRYIEKFGNTDQLSTGFNYFLPGPYKFDTTLIIHDWPSTISFICFEDSSFPVYNNTDKPCEYYLDLVNINETQLSGIELYPNPTEGIFTIDNPESHDLAVDIYNIQGRLLDAFSVRATSKKEINISEYTNGLYFVRITNALNETKTIKIVKQ